MFITVPNFAGFMYFCSGEAAYAAVVDVTDTTNRILNSTCCVFLSRARVNFMLVFELVCLYLSM